MVQVYLPTYTAYAFQDCFILDWGLCVIGWQFFSIARFW